MSRTQSEGLRVSNGLGGLVDSKYTCAMSVHF